MNVSEPFIHRPVGTFLLAAGLFLLGIVAYESPPVAPIPRVDFPIAAVNAQLPGTGAANPSGRVQRNPAALASTGLSLEDVRAFLSQANVDMPKGGVDGEQASYTIYSSDQLLRADESRGLVLSQKNGTSMRLSSL